ncbi:hypothetical protein ACMD2_26967, partial [Ananas comosus]
PKNKFREKKFDRVGFSPVLSCESGCTKGGISAEISAWCRSYYKLKISQLSIEVRNTYGIEHRE